MMSLQSVSYGRAMLVALAVGLPVGLPALPRAAAADEVYRVGSGDVIHVAVFDEPTLTGEFTVDPNGRIVYPLLGEVAVDGQTVNEMTNALTRLLAADYLFNPQVSVTIKEHKSQKVEILGSVNSPGTYYLEQPTRLFDLLAQAGGIAERLGPVRRGQTLRIRRPDPALENGEIKVDLYDLLVDGDLEANVAVRGGDVIYVPENQSVHVIGEVKDPGTFPYEEGMTVLKAVTLAGGNSKKASLKHATIRRIREGKEIKIKASLEDELEPDDIVEVKKSFW